MQNASLAFGNLTWNLSKGHIYNLNFSDHKRFVLREKDMVNLSIHWAFLKIVSIWISAKCKFCFWNFNSLLELSAFLQFRFLETYVDAY